MAEEITLASLARAAGKDNTRQEIQKAAETATLTFNAEERQQIDQIKQELDLTDSVTAVEYGTSLRRRWGLPTRPQSTRPSGSLIR